MKKQIDVNGFIESVGGRKSVIDETELSKARISQWVNENSIPSAWIKYFGLKYPAQCEQYGLSK